MSDAPDDDTSCLIGVLRDRGEPILARWEALARERLGLDDLSRCALRDHLPQVLGEVRAFLAEPAAASGRGAERHATDRLERGFDLGLVVREYDLLRDCVVEAWRAAQGSPTHHPEAPCLRLNEAFELLVEEAVAVHLREEERTLRSLARGVRAGVGADLDVTLPHIAGAALEAVEPAECVAFHVAAGERLTLRAQVSSRPELLADEALAERAARLRAPLSERRERERPARLVVPLIEEGDLLGVAQMASRSVDEFMQAEALVFRAVANRAAASVLQSRHAAAEREALRRLAQTSAILQALYDNAPVGLAYLDEDLRYAQVNATLAAFNGRSAAAHLGRHVAEVLPDVAARIEPHLRDALAPGAGPRELELSGNSPARPDVPARWALNVYPVVDPSSGRRGLGVIVRDVTAEWLAREALEARARQQAELAALGLRALQAPELQVILDDAVATVSRTLDVELVKVLEVTGDPGALLLRAGVGWREGLVGRVTVPSEGASQAGFTLLSRTPVSVEDLAVETRFRPPALLLDHAVVSGVSAAIEAPGPAGRSYGVLGAHSRRRRSFSPEDAAFLQSVANVIGASILRARSSARAEAEHRRGDREQFLAEAGALLASTLDHEETVTEIAQLCVRSLADCCVIDLVEDGALRRVRVAHRAPLAAPLAERLQALELAPDRPHLGRGVLATGEPMLLRDLTPEQLAALAQTEVHLEVLRALRPVSLLALPLEAHGRILGALVLLSCTEGRRFGPDDLQLARELARRAALAVESAGLYAQARSAVRAREAVLAVVAHDLRAPLAAIALSAGALREQLARGARDQSAATIDRVERASTQASRLIQDLLDVASIDAGELRLDRAPMRPEAAITDALELVATSAEAAGLTLESDVAAGLPAVLADRGRLAQVLSNLLVNAVKFTPAGGHVRLRAERRGEAVQLSVSDSGPGIPAEHQQRLFDRFWQARAGDRGGVGLGLSIAKGIVDAHRGRIWLESAPGRGSTFFVTIPRA